MHRAYSDFITTRAMVYIPQETIYLNDNSLGPLSPGGIATHHREMVGF
jgi:hypothetical protein